QGRRFSGSLAEHQGPQPGRRRPPERRAVGDRERRRPRGRSADRRHGPRRRQGPCVPGGLPDVHAQGGLLTLTPGAAARIYTCIKDAGMASRIKRATDKGRLGSRSEEHTSELQSRFDLVCRLLLEKKTLDSTVVTCL